MRITAEILERVLRTLGPDDDVGGNRSCPRVSLGGTVTVLLLPTRTDHPAHLRDVSRGGVSLLVPARVEAGQRFVVVLPRGGGGPDLVLVCQAARCTPVNDRMTSIGARFVARSAPPKQQWFKRPAKVSPAKGVGSSHGSAH